MKSIIDILAEHLALIFNKCISEGYFPDDLKIAQLIPIFNLWDTKKPNNYGPISILTKFSKIVEEHIYLNWMDYVDENQIFSNQQWGFRKGIFTNNPIGQFLD